MFRLINKKNNIINCFQTKQNVYNTLIVPINLVSLKIIIYIDY